MHYTPSQYAHALYTLTRDVESAQAQKVVDQFADHIKASGHAHLFASILTAYRGILLRHNERPEVVVRSAEALSNEKIAEILSSLQISAGRPVQNIVDTEMIGGVIVKDNNRAFDLSLKRRLARLGQKLGS